MTEQDYDVSVLHASEGVLEHLQIQCPAMLILDIMLPGMDGLSLCKLIRSIPKLAGLKIILLTGRHFEDDKRRADAVGADLLMRKPFQAADLVKAVGSLLARERTG